MELKLLIADDEVIERRALQMQIQKAFPDIKLLKSAANGFELVDVAREQRPDIVLADIEMPGMSGLAALEMLQAEGIHPRVVIMTAYSSENYLRQSLSLRVYEYLEKPLRRDRVESTLRALIQEIQEEYRRGKELEQMRETIRSMHRMICSELMSTIESDEADPAQIGELLEMLEMETRRFLVMTFSLAEAFPEAGAHYSRRIEELRVFSALREAIRRKGWINGHIINHRMSCLVPVRINAEKDDDYRIRQAACFEADSILKVMEKQCGLRVGIGVSTVCPQSLQVSRQQSVRALCRQDARSAICHYEDQPLPHGVENLFVAGETTLLECLQSGNIVQTESAVHKCFATLPGWIAFSSVRNQVFELLLALNRRSGAQLFEDIPGAVSEKLQCCQSRRELEDCVLNLCRECIRRNQDSDSLWQEDVIQRARRYIDACYNTEISLEETAEAVGVSKFYLSRLFKLRLGTNYSTYLTEKRVHMAASLIEAQRELSNREIAERVGFRDPDYFGKVFKRAFGCTVSEYREKNYEGGNRT